jgi:hypothetical protein
MFNFSQPLEFTKFNMPTPTQDEHLLKRILCGFLAGSMGMVITGCDALHKEMQGVPWEPVVGEEVYCMELINTHWGERYVGTVHNPLAGLDPSCNAGLANPQPDGTLRFEDSPEVFLIEENVNGHTYWKVVD